MLYFIVILIIALAFSHRYAWWRSAVDYNSPRILMYHMIKTPIKGAKFNGLRVSPEMFEKQLCYFKNNGWNFVTMSELIGQFKNLPGKTVAITFDDGFEDNYLYAFPLLKKYQAKATLYLVVDRHNNDWSTKKKSYHNSGELSREPKLTDEQVQAMLDSGVFELGGHTLTHCNLNQLTQEQKLHELTESKNILEKNFNTKILSFAYPFGIYKTEDVALVKACGYTSAVTTEAGIDQEGADFLQLSRVKISGKDNFYAFKLRIKTGMRGWSK